MHRHRRRILTLIAACCLLVLQAHAQVDDMEDAPAAPEYECVRFGLCEPCPTAALHQPYCQPYGNRRLLHCFVKGNGTVDDDHTHDGQHSATDGHIPAWEACGRSPTQERADYWQFVMCNVFFAMLALVVLLARSRVVAAMQARRLAARIGVRWTAGIGNTGGTAR